MRRVVRTAILLNLIAVTVLTVAMAHLMISPGRLIDGHRETETDCFVCHDGFFGASTQKCVSCHKVPDIGKTTVKGVPVTAKKPVLAFHDKLADRGCVACHSDHVGLMRYRVPRPFPHGAVEVKAQQQCASCHRDPDDPLHRAIADGCGDCHKVETWKPATFEHDVLAAADLETCLTCHKPDLPKDDLHERVSPKCGVCHATTSWKRSCPGFCGYKLDGAKAPGAMK